MSPFQVARRKTEHSPLLLHLVMNVAIVTGSSLEDFITSRDALEIFATLKEFGSFVKGSRLQ